MPTWPYTVPQTPIYGGFTEQRQPNLAAFSPEVGPPKLRRRSTAAAVQTSAVFKMTDAELADFNTFYETTLEDGALSFTWDHPITAVNYSWIFSPDDVPQIEATAPDHHTVTVKLLRLP